MAAENFNDWIPEEWDSAVVQEVMKTSAIEARARRHPMSTDTRHVPRSHGVDVDTIAKASDYEEDVTGVDEVLLSAIKFGKAVRIADEDLKDSNVNIIQTKMTDWANAYAKLLDNSCLGVTAASNGGTVPFTSVYRALRTTNADTGYTADDNYVAGATGGITYDDLSNTLGLYEVGNHFDLQGSVVIAHPAFRKALRGIRDDQGLPVFVQGQGGDSGTPDTLFDIPVNWSYGARTSAVAETNPTGNPIMVVGNASLLLLGVRSGPESMTAAADSGVGFLSDTALLKMRSRRGFAVGFEQGFAVLEDLS